MGGRDAADGYLTELEYHWYYALDQEPLRQCVVAAIAGVIPPRLDRPFTMLDLGCGPGLTILVQAACYPHARFIGVDFDERVIARGRAFAQEAGLTNVTFIAAPFGELGPNDLPLCDFVGSHGVLSWVSPENRETVYRLADRHLAPGGLLYLSYDSRGGNVGTVPWRRLWADHAATTDGPIADRIGPAFDASTELAAAGAPILDQWRGLVPTVDFLKTRPVSFLAPEYFGRWWEPLWFDEVARGLDRFGIRWIGRPCPTRATDFRVTPEQRALADTIADPRVRETVLDLCAAPRFRPDLYYRGPVPQEVTTYADRPSLRHLHFATLSTREGAFATAEERLNAQKITEAAGTNGRPWAEIARIVGLPAPRAIPLLRRLLYDGILRPVARPIPPVAETGPLSPVNASLVRLAASGAPIPGLAAPALGSILVVDPKDLQALDAEERGAPLPNAALAARLRDRILPRLARYGGLA